MNLVCFSLDGKYLVSGSLDGSIIFWDFELQAIVAEHLDGNVGAVRSVALSPDGNQVAWGSEDRTVCIGNILPSKPIVAHNDTERLDAIVHATARIPSASPLSPSVHSNVSLTSTRHFQNGWLVGPEGELIPWIPPSHRVRLCDLRVHTLLGDPERHPNILDFNEMACGTDWMKCRTHDFAERDISP